MKLTTYFRAMERAQEVGKFITSYHLRAGLIRRMERAEHDLALWKADAKRYDTVEELFADLEAKE
jgi:hypothetical protein